MATPMFCPNCETTDTPTRVTKGSFLTELVVWIAGVVLAFYFIPLVALGPAYSVWRLASRYTACPQCRQPGMVPLDSPRAQRAGATAPPKPASDFSEWG